LFYAQVSVELTIIADYLRVAQFCFARYRFVWFDRYVNPAVDRCDGYFQPPVGYVVFVAP